MQLLIISQCVFKSPFNETSDELYATKIIGSLVKCSRLHTIAISTVDDVLWTYQEFRTCPLNAIQVDEPLTLGERNYLDSIPVPIALIKFAELPYVSYPQAMVDV